MLNYFPNFFTRVKLWNRTKQRAEKLKQELSELFSEVEFIVVDASNHCVSDADCIVTATNSSQPLFAISDLKENVHVNGKRLKFVYYSLIFLGGVIQIFKNSIDFFYKNYVNSTN
jgi:glutamyl-tRNA reductase